MQAKHMLFFLFGIYSSAMLILEFMFYQKYVRMYFTDITGPVFFYGVNTTLSTAILWGIALVFFVCHEMTPQTDKRRRLFYLSQTALFLFLGFDDRFLFHEWLGGQIRINDAYILVGIGLIEVGLIGYLGRFCLKIRKARTHLIIAAIFFGLMVLVDAFAPSRLRFRLSVEDLSKIWADLFLFLFSWEILKHHIHHKSFSRIQ